MQWASYDSHICCKASSHGYDSDSHLSVADVDTNYVFQSASYITPECFLLVLSNTMNVRSQLQLEPVAEIVTQIGWLLQKHDHHMPPIYLLSQDFLVALHLPLTSGSQQE